MTRIHAAALPALTACATSPSDTLAAKLGPAGRGAYAAGIRWTLEAGK